MAQETSLDKALNVLEMIAQAGAIRLSTMAETTGYPPATIHRILGVLVQRRYVRQDPSNRKYMLSLKCLDISSKVKDNLEIITAARPVMQKLMERAGETVNLVCFEDMEAVYVDQISNTKSLLRMFTRVGAGSSPQLRCGQGLSRRSPAGGGPRLFQKREKSALHGKQPGEGRRVLTGHRGDPHARIRRGPGRVRRRCRLHCGGHHPKGRSGGCHEHLRAEFQAFRGEHRPTGRRSRLQRRRRLTASFRALNAAPITCPHLIPIGKGAYYA